MADNTDYLDRFMLINPHFFARHCTYERWCLTEKGEELRIDARCLFGDFIIITIPTHSEGETVDRLLIEQALSRDFTWGSSKPWKR